MSAGARIPRAAAERAVEHLRARLGLLELDEANPEDGRALAVMAVGSVRRLAADVGDVELIAPMPHPDEDGDPLHEALARHFHPAEGEAAPPPPPPKPRQLMLGAPVTEPAPPPAVEAVELGQRFGAALRGLKPGFRSASLVLELKHPVAMPLPIQVYRFDPGAEGNRGWVEVMRTGPAEFGKGILARWRKRQGHEEQPGSVDGYFADVDGRLIPTPTEKSVFALVGLGWIAPLMRQGIAERWAAAANPRERRRRWA